MRWIYANGEKNCPNRTLKIEQGKPNQAVAHTNTKQHHQSRKTGQDNPQKHFFIVTPKRIHCKDMVA